jgi:hypothetical protein
VASLADRDGSGLVLLGDDAIDGVRELRRRSFTRPVLVDRRRYAGNSRTHGAEALSPWWITEQRRLGVSSVLTDSGYIGEECLTDLRSVLARAADLGDDVTAVLPLQGAGGSGGLFRASARSPRPSTDLKYLRGPTGL